MANHPIQPLEIDKRGTHRFKSNRIVEYLLEKGGIGLNDLADFSGEEGFPREDWVQFAQLIGYSVDGWETLSYVKEEDCEAVSKFHSDKGLSFDAARAEALQELVKEIREGMAKPMATLYGGCSENLLERYRCFGRSMNDE